MTPRAWQPSKRARELELLTIPVTRPGCVLHVPVIDDDRRSSRQELLVEGHVVLSGTCLAGRPDAHHDQAGIRWLVGEMRPRITNEELVQRLELIIGHGGHGILNRETGKTDNTRDRERPKPHAEANEPVW
jgi:hypothetical protein